MTDNYKWPIGAALINLLAAVAIIRFGPFAETAFGHDAFILLAGGWKLAHGLRPSRDFYSPLGIITYIIPALGIQIFGPSAHVLSFTSAGWLVLTTIICFTCLIKRMPSLLLAVTIFISGLVASSPRHIGFPYNWVTYAITYDRICIALLGVFTLSILLGTKVESRLNDAQRAIAGLVLALLCFLKVSFLVGAIPIIALAVVTQKLSRKDLAILVISGLFGVAAILLSSQTNPLYIYADYSLAGHVREGTLMSGFKAAVYFWQFIAFFFMVYGVIVFLRAQHKGQRTVLEFVATAAVLIGVVIFIFITGAPVKNFPECPYISFCVIYLIAELIVARQLFCKALYYPLMLALAAALLLKHTIKDVRAFEYAFKNTRALRRSVSTPRFAMPSLRDLIITGDGGDPHLPLGYVGKLNAAITMLKTNLPPNSRVLTFDFTDPYPFALGWPPAPHAPLFWHYGVVYNEKYYPDPKIVFDSVDAVLVPEQFGTGFATDSSAILKIYGPTIKNEFKIAAKDSQWTLFMRRK